MNNSPLENIEKVINLASKEFLRGFFAGQVTLLLLLFGLVKFFFFRNSLETREKNYRLRARNDQLAITSNTSAPKSADQPARRSPAPDSVFAGTWTPDQEESCVWFQTVIAQLFAKYSQDAGLVRLIKRSILSSITKKKPAFLGNIAIKDLMIGRSASLNQPTVPLIKNIRNYTSSHAKKLTFDIEWSSPFSIVIDTLFMINWPKEEVASLPISLTIELVNFAAPLSIEFSTAGDCSKHCHSNSNTNTNTDKGIHCQHRQPAPVGFYLYLEKEFDYEIDTKSLLGHRTKVKDLPKLTNFLSSKIASLMQRTIVHPNRIFVPFPHV